jgi:hypothetical protein
LKFYQNFTNGKDGGYGMKRKFVVVLALVAFGLVLSSKIAHAQVIATNEAFSSCTGMLCLDAPPEGPKGLDGSGGWGWSTATNSPVLFLTVGKAAGFTVTVMQPNTLPFCNAANMTITLTYSSQDFTLSATDSTTTAGTNPFDRGGVMTFTYGGSFLCHTDQSVAYTFTPQNPTATALVTATVSVAGQQASETFPVTILPKAVTKGH